MGIGIFGAGDLVVEKGTGVDLVAKSVDQEDCVATLK
jgi:hypothetical protein